VNIESKSDFYQQLRECLPPGTTLKTANRVADAYAKAVHRALASGADTVKLPDICTISCRIANPRIGHNPYTGRQIHIDGIRVANISAHASLKRIVKDSGK
jgi:nucleoid DNA-binding protein